MGRRFRKGEYKMPHDQTAPPKDLEDWRAGFKKEQEAEQGRNSISRMGRSIVDMSQTAVMPFPEAVSESAEYEEPPAA